MTDTLERPFDLDDDVRERPVVTRRPLRAPDAPYRPLSITVQYPPGPVPDLEDAVPEPVQVRARVLRLALGLRLRIRPSTWHRSRVVAGLLGVFVGGLGLHRMYLGHWRRGLTMLAITVVGGLFTLGLAALVMGACGFIEGLLYLSVRRGRFARDAYGKPLRG